MSKSFPHPPGLSGVLLNRDLEQQFKSWLSEVSPGASASGRVANVHFSDSVENDCCSSS